MYMFETKKQVKAIVERKKYPILNIFLKPCVFTHLENIYPNKINGTAIPNKK